MPSAIINKLKSADVRGITTSPGYLHAGLLLLLTFLAYSSVFSAGFIWDDDAYVIDNICLRTVEGLAAIWFEPGATPQYYPLVFTLFWLQFKLWGLAPLGYHIVNIALHGANAVLLLQTLKRLNIPAAFWIAALFALHPVHVESVAWITELKNVLSTFFALLSFLLYWRFNEILSQQLVTKRVCLLYSGALFAFLLALLSKSVVGSLPAVILLLIWWQQGRFSRLDVVRLVPFFVLALVAGWNTARLEVSHVLASGIEWDFSFVERLLIAGRAIWFYAAKLLWPHPLIFNYERWQIDASVWWQHLFPLGVIAVALVLWLVRHKTGRGPLAGYLFFIGTLFPALGFFNVYPMRYSFVADHFQYVASIGFISLFGATAWCLAEKFQIRSGGTRFFAAGALLLLAALTWRQGRIYHDRMTLFTDTIEKNPQSWLSYSNRGRDYALMGREDLALVDINKSLVLNPNDADALQVRGAIALKYRDFEKALADMTRSIELYPLRIEYLSNRSLANRNAGKIREAVADASQVIMLAPDDPQSYLYRASLHAAAGDSESAIADIGMAEKMGLQLDDNEKLNILSVPGLKNPGRVSR